MAPKARVQKRLYYKIGEACKALDIQPYVLRYWETEFPALSPSKSRSGQRVYSEKELAVIRRIKELLYEEGYTIAGAKKKLESELANGTLGEESERSGPRGLAPTSEKAAKDAVERPAEAPQEAGRSSPPRPEPAPQEALPLGETGPPLDTRAAERVETLRQGIEEALVEAREILALLESTSPSCS